MYLRCSRFSSVVVSNSSTPPANPFSGNVHPHVAWNAAQAHILCPSASTRSRVVRLLAACLLAGWLAGLPRLTLLSPTTSTTTQENLELLKRLGNTFEHLLSTTVPNTYGVCSCLVTLAIGSASLALASGPMGYGCLACRLCRLCSLTTSAVIHCPSVHCPSVGLEDNVTSLRNSPFISPRIENRWI